MGPKVILGIYMFYTNINTKFITIKYTTTKTWFFKLLAFCLKSLYSQYLEYISSLKWLNVFIMTNIKNNNVHYD